MGTKVAVILAAAMLAGISGVSTPSQGRDGQNAPKPLPEPLRNLLATGAGRAVGLPEERNFCGWLRGFVHRYGRDRAVEIARLKYSDAVIEESRRACFPGSRPIDRR